MAQPQPISDEDRLQVKQRMLHGMLTAGGNRTQQELEKTVMELETGAYAKFADDKAKYWKRLENSVIKYQKLVDKERADLQAAPPAQAQASAAPGGPGRPPTPSTQPGMWPAAQPAAVAGFPGTAAPQLGSQGMAGHQPSSPAHLRMPQGMAVQQASSQAQQTAYMQQPRSVPMGHLHQPQMRQQQAQAGGHQGAMQGLLHEGMLLPGHQEVSTGDAEFADMAAAFFDSSPQPAQQAQQQPAAAWPPPQQAQQQHQALLYQQQQRHLQQQQQMGMSGGPHPQSQAGVFAQAGQQYPTVRSASQQHAGQPLRAAPLTQQQHHHLGQAAGQYPGQAAGQSAGQYPGQGAGQSAGQHPGQAAGQFAGQQQHPGQYPGQPAGQQQRPGQYPGLQQQHPGQAAGQAAGQAGGQQHAAGQAAATQDTLALFQSTYALFQQNLDLVKAALTEYKVAISRGPSVASAVGENQLNTYGQVLNTAVKSLQGRWNQPTPELSNNPQVVTLLKQAQSAFTKPQPQQPGEAPGPSYVETCRSVLAEAIANQGAAAPSSMGPPAQVQQPQQQAPPQQQVPSQTAAHQQQQQVPSQTAAHQQQQQVPSQTAAHQQQVPSQTAAHHQQQQVPSQTAAHQQQQPPQAVQAVPPQPQQTHTLPAHGQAVAGAGLRGQASAMTPASQQQQPAAQPQSVTVELAAQQATGQPLGQAGAQPGAPGLPHGQVEGPTATLTAGQILCNLVGAAPDLALDQTDSGLSRMLWHSGCHVPALPAELTGQAGIQSPTSVGQPGAWLPSSELVPDGMAGHGGVAPRGGPGVSSAGQLQAQGLGLGPGPLVTGPVASPLPSPFGFFTSPALGLTSTVNGMLLGMGLRNMGLHDPLPTPLPGYGQTLPDRAGSAPVAVLGGPGLESKTSSAEGWMMSGGRGLGSSLARNNSLAYSSSLSSNASMASSSTYLGSGMCSAASLPVSLSVPNLVLSKVASQAVMEGREAPESPASTQSPALASRPLSLLGKRKSATQLVNQERVLQKRQRLAHVEEAVNTLADAMAPVAQLRTADCSAFEDAMLVSCTVGKNAALPEPSSPDSTPQWRTLSLRVSERYPAESPVALFNCPADGLPVPPQAEAARSVFEASVSMLPQPLDLKTMMESWHKAVASVDKAYSSQPAAPAPLAGSSGSLAYGGPLLAGSPAVRGLQ